MKIKPFQLERYFAKYEFSAPYLLSSSDCEALELKELLEMADLETRALWDGLKLSYTESSGHPLLREEITKLYNSISADEVNVMVPEEGIFIAMNCMLEKGDHVVATFPGYQSLYEIASSLGCEVSFWQPEKNNGWFFDVEKLKSLIRAQTKLVVVNFPHNPTGATISREQQKEIIDVCRENGITLFSDEMYRFLEYDEADRLPSASDLYENVISLFGLSKSFALPGLRIGWLVSKNKKLMDEISGFKDYTTICNNAPGEILAIMALQSREKIVSRNLNLISRNLDILDNFFNQHENLFEWQRPKAGPIAFPGWKGRGDVNSFCQKLVDEKGVMLLPSGVYDFAGNNFRIGFARKNMPQSLEKLDEFLNQNQQL